MFSTPVFDVIGTPLLATSYDQLGLDLLAASRSEPSLAIDFSNTHIVTARRHEPEFRQITECFAAFVPDGMPLVWCLNAQGAGLKDRVYGPTFTRRFLATCPPEPRHYFLGGAEECLGKLLVNLRAANPTLNIVGQHHGYFQPADEAALVAGIVASRAQFLWVGLGTPKQQAWISRHHAQLPGIIVLAVGFAFDVIAGTKADAPLWAQRYGLTWIYRLCSEPRRLLGRYLRYNSLFLRYLIIDFFKR